MRFRSASGTVEAVLVGRRNNPEDKAARIRGLAVYNMASGRWGFFTAGLPSRNVTAVEARGGVLYIGTDNGLVKVPESTVGQ